MIFRFLRWLGKNLGTLLLAFMLAVVVWVSAVTSTNPNEEQDLARSIAVEIVGQDAGLVITEKSASQIRLRLDAPRSLWEGLNNGDSEVRAWIDLSSLGPGTHVLPVQVQVDARPVRLIRVTPDKITLTLERLVTQSFPITLLETGKVATGYTADEALIEPEAVNVAGPESAVAKVQMVRAVLDISGASETISSAVSLTALDANGAPVSGLSISPPTATVSQPVHILGGYRSVIVRAVTQGQVAAGYKLTSLILTPPSVVVYSANPQLVNDLPGYVETEPLNLTNAQDDFEVWLALNLPDGIHAVEDTEVLAQVSVAAIESSITLGLPVELVGLTPLYQAEASPLVVDVTISGPVPLLNALKPKNLHLMVDLSTSGVGVFQMMPLLSGLPERLQVTLVFPQQVEVRVWLTPTATPTSTPTPTPTPLLTETPTPTKKPVP